MNTSINIQRLVPTFLACLIIASTPSLFFWYIIVLAVCVKVFLVICIIDYFRRTSMRKNAGLIVGVMILAAIASLIILYFTNSLLK